MIKINWDPISHLGPIPINWYGLFVALGFIVGWLLVRRWAARFDVSREKVDALLIWIIVGAIIGARVYYIVQNQPGDYLRQPLRIVALWEGGLAFFGGLFGAIIAAFVYTRREKLSFSRIGDLFAPAIPVGSAIGRIACGLAGMDYGTPTKLPWGVIYTNPNSYAPMDGVPRHPDQYYELLGDLIIAGILIKLRGKEEELMSSQKIVAIILIIVGAVLVLWVLTMWMMPSMMGSMMGGMMGSMIGCMGMCTFGPLLLAAVLVILGVVLLRMGR